MKKSSSYQRQSREVESYSLPDVAIATKIATDDFKDGWAKGFTSRNVRSALSTLEEDGKRDEQAGIELVVKAYEYWDSLDDEFAMECKSMFAQMECQGDKVGLLAYAIWQGIKVARFNESGARDDFKRGDKILDLTLKYESTVETTYNYAHSHGFGGCSYLNHDQTTYHDMCVCDRYPNVSFDVVLLRKTNADWNRVMTTHEDAPKDRDADQVDFKNGDIIKITAKVKDIDPRSSTVYLNFGKIIDVVKFSANAE